MNLDVISRATVMTYRANPQPVAQVARDLHVSHVLEGTVRRDGRQIRVTLRLVDAKQDRQLWADTFHRELGDATSLQVELANKVAEHLAVRLIASPSHMPPSGNLEAYDLWLKGTLAWQNGIGSSWQQVDRV